jgi:hypothetical protein
VTGGSGTASGNGDSARGADALAVAVARVAPVGGADEGAAVGVVSAALGVAARDVSLALGVVRAPDVAAPLPALGRDIAGGSELLRMNPATTPTAAPNRMATAPERIR